MATIDDLKDYYAGLLIVQYATKPRALATVKALVSPVLMPDGTGEILPLAIQAAFDITTAVGKQLDTLGECVGVKRQGNGPYGLIVLDDNDFRTLVTIATAQNNLGSSLQEIADFFHEFFPGQVLVFDHFDMRLSYLIDTGLGSTDLLYLLAAGGHIPRPMGVQTSIIGAPTIDAFFGFCTYANSSPTGISPFNTYDDYETDWPWLSYVLDITE